MPTRKYLLYLSCLLLFAGAACKLTATTGSQGGGASSPTPNVRLALASQPLTPTLSPTQTSSPSPSSTPTLTPPATATETSTGTPARSPSPTQTPAETDTAKPSLTPTATITPTYTILRGRVLELANCRYGPGAAYLYKYALIEGSNLEVIGRNDLGTWILIQAIGGHNPCWVKASLLKLNGDVMSVAPTYILLPQSPYYGPLTGVSAVREGDVVILSWNPLYLRAGDDSLQFPYLVEAWLCKNGELVFTPIGSYQTIANVTDDPGCSQPSHARVYGVEKHGYTRPVDFSWPPQP